MKYFVLLIYFCLYLSAPSVANETQICVKLQSNRHVPSAVGIRWRKSDHTIYYVDTNSSVFGTVHPGDVLITADGMCPEEWFRTESYINNEETPVQLVVRQQGYIRQVIAYRKPTSLFSPIWHQGSRY